jgi:hypothetical protein
VQGEGEEGEEATHVRGGGDANMTCAAIGRSAQQSVRRSPRDSVLRCAKQDRSPQDVTLDKRVAVDYSLQ